MAVRRIEQREVVNEVNVLKLTWVTVVSEVSQGLYLLNVWPSIQCRASLPGCTRRQQRRRTSCWSAVYVFAEEDGRGERCRSPRQPVWRTPARETLWLVRDVEGTLKGRWRTLKRRWTSVPQLLHVNCDDLIVLCRPVSLFVVVSSLFVV